MTKPAQIISPATRDRRRFPDTRATLLIGFGACLVYLGLIFWATGGVSLTDFGDLLFVAALAITGGMAPFCVVAVVGAIAGRVVGMSAARGTRRVGLLVTVGILWLGGANLDLRADPLAAIAAATFPLALGAMLFVGALVPILAFAAFGSREAPPDRARYLCSACGYDLRGLAKPQRCPECGREFVGA